MLIWLWLRFIVCIISRMIALLFLAFFVKGWSTSFLYFLFGCGGGGEDTWFIIAIYGINVGDTVLDYLGGDDVSVYFAFVCLQWYTRMSQNLFVYNNCLVLIITNRKQYSITIHFCPIFNLTNISMLILKSSLLVNTLVFNLTNN